MGKKRFDIKDLLQTAENMQPLEEQAMADAKARQASLAKPPGSLGKLEDISVKMAGITGKVINSIDRSCVIVMCADNGVVAEGISSAPQSVTMAQTINFTRRLTGVGALAESFGSELLIVDLGISGSIPQELYDSKPLKDTHKIVNRRIRQMDGNGSGETGNIAKEPAMTREEALKCIETGMEMADAVRDAGFDIVGIGEMGIGNTTTSAAVLSALTGLDAEYTCGKGGGIVDAAFARKKEIVNAVSRKYREEAAESGKSGTTDGETDIGRTLDILAAMGGFDICAMTGAFIGAAKNRMPAVIDGYISVVAALAAYTIAPQTVGYMFASHKSWEQGYSIGIEALGLEPFLDLNMRLGEGSGCPIAFNVIKGACDVMADMATFEEAEINDDYLEEIRKGNCF